MQLPNEEKEDLKEILKEYLLIFEKSKKHQKEHRREPCAKCELTKKLLLKLD